MAVTSLPGDMTNNSQQSANSFHISDIDFDESAYPNYKTVSRSASWMSTEAEDEFFPMAGGNVAAANHHPKAAKAEDDGLQLQNLAHPAQVQDAWNTYVVQADREATSAGDTPPMAMPMMMPMLVPWQQVAVMPMMPYPEPGFLSVPTPSNSIPVPAAPPSSTASGSAPGKTTIMWRNLPNNYCRDELLALIDSHGFAGAYSFFYAPMDFTCDALVGYAFIDFVCTGEADRFYHHFQGFTDWSLKSLKVSEVTWSHPLQGLEGHIQRYRNSPVMHPDVDDANRPVLFRNGQRIPFPPPTKNIRAPNLKDCRARGV